MDLNKLTAARIKELRISKNISQEAFARELEISKTACSQLENGNVEITLNRLDTIAKIWKMPIAQLVPAFDAVAQMPHVNGLIINDHSLINDLFTAEDRLQSIADNLNAAIAEMRRRKKG